MHRHPPPLRKNRLFLIRFLVWHVICHSSQRGGKRDDVSAGCGVRRRDGWHFRLLDLWPSTDGLFSRQLKTISFENDSELTYGIILTNFGIAFAFALSRFAQLKCKHKRKCKQKEMTFFLFLASALGWPLGFLFPFRTQPKKTLWTGLNHTCCVELRYGCCVSCVVALYCVCIYAGSRLHTENKDPRDSWDTFNAVFLFCILYQLSRNIGGTWSFFKRVSRRGVS